MAAVQDPNAFYGVQWGKGGYRTTGLQADYDGDGRDDLTVAGNVSGFWVWFILRSNTNTFSAIQFGLSSDIPVTGADYVGDGRAEITVIRTYAGQQPARSSTYFGGDSDTGALVFAQD